MNKRNLAILLAATSLPLQAEVLWQDFSVSYLNGSNYRVDGPDKQILTFEHVAGTSWGDSFFFLDHLRGDNGSRDNYAEWSPRLSFSKLSGQPLQYGVIKDVLFTSTVEMSALRTDFLYGVATDLALPGFSYLNLNFYRRNNDGLADLFVAKGNVWEMPDFAMADPNNLLLQGADGVFVEAADKAGVAVTERGGIVSTLRRGEAPILARYEGSYAATTVTVIDRYLPLALGRSSMRSGASDGPRRPGPGPPVPGHSCPVAGPASGRPPPHGSGSPARCFRGRRTGRRRPRGPGLDAWLALGHVDRVRRMVGRARVGRRSSFATGHCPVAGDPRRPARPDRTHLVGIRPHPPQGGRGVYPFRRRHAPGIAVARGAAVGPAPAHRRQPARAPLDGRSTDDAG